MQWYKENCHIYRDWQWQDFFQACVKLYTLNIKWTNFNNFFMFMGPIACLKYSIPNTLFQCHIHQPNYAIPNTFTSNTIQIRNMPFQILSLPSQIKEYEVCSQLTRLPVERILLIFCFLNNVSNFTFASL